MSYISFIPCDLLKPYVRLYAISRNEKPDSYKILPDTAIVMGFQFSGQLSYNNYDAKIELSHAGITGLRDTYRIFNNSAHTGTVLVMFTEMGAAAFFGYAIHELFGQSLGLDNLILSSQMDIVSEQLNDAKTDMEKIHAIERFLISRLNANAKDDLVSLGINLIKQSNGTIKISLLAEKLNISQSRFEKRFRSIVGASPKKFASIVRLRSILDHSAKMPSLTQLAFDKGYFDQAHFIKDFKAFTGETPEHYFKKT